MVHDKVKIPNTDLKSKIKKYFDTKWQQYSHNNIYNKQFLIKATLGGQKPVSQNTEKSKYEDH